MKMFYLIGAIIFFLMILTLALPQIGTTCAFYLIKTNSNPAFVLFQVAGLGAAMGGLLVMYWKMPRAASGDDEDSSEA